MLPSPEKVESRPSVIETSVNSHWLVNTEIRYYKLSSDVSYHYEFRYQWSKDSTSHRLMLLLGGQNRSCIDWWTFSVGRRILSTIRASNYSILSICSNRSTFDHNAPIEENLDVKWIYKSLQVWMNAVYHAKYDRYPVLYLYGVSRGSHFAGLLCRVLPVQAQILYIYPGYFEGMTTRSTLEVNLHKRLILDTSFASWFTFKYCYVTKSDSCAFHTATLTNYYPVPPTYFVHVVNDAKLNKSDYEHIITAVKNDAFHLGGALLNDSKALLLHVAFPPKPTPLYMQEHFYQWRHKPHASKLLYEHLMGFPKLPEQQNSEYKFQTFWCHRGDFTYFERYPSIMKTWSEQEQEEYRDYSNDIKTYHELLTEEFCGDMRGQHAMLSLDLDQALHWLIEIDGVRHQLHSRELASRTLRIWMYDKEDLIPEPYRNHHLNANCSHNAYSHRMYLSENIVQDHFRHLKETENPLLADYFLIPHDLYCFIFFHQLFANFTDAQFKAHVSYYSQHYFEPLINTVRSKFPYWTLPNHPGANHIIAFVGGRNMGILDDHLQKLLQHVIQLGPTGIRQDLLPKNAPELYLHRNLSTIYRHGYDIVIPPYTPIESDPLNINSTWYHTKTNLLFFAGALNHSLSPKSARNALRTVSKSLANNLVIKGKEFSVINITDGYMDAHDYRISMTSSVFALCPEGYGPWTPRIYEAINLGSVPLVLANGIVFPFERFIPWRSFSLKLNVSNINTVVEFIIGNETMNFDKHVMRKVSRAQQYVHAFRWQSEDTHTSKLNVFHYIKQELQCRRLEQLWGATSAIHSDFSQQARQHVCKRYSKLCPCPTYPPLAFDQYSYDE